MPVSIVMTEIWRRQNLWEGKNVWRFYFFLNGFGPLLKLKYFPERLLNLYDKFGGFTSFSSLTEVKEIMWRISGECIVGKIKRQGAAKTQSEINGICCALKILSEKDFMPMFLSTSNKVSHTPIYNSYPVEDDNSEVNARLELVEKSFYSILNK